MSARPPARPITALLGAPVLALALTACGAGFQANTYLNRNLDDAANSQVGQLSLRNVYIASPDEGIVHPEGSDAELQLAVVNNANVPDRLVSVRTEAARSASLLENGRRVSSLEIPPTALAGDLTVELSELTRPLRSGEYIDVTVRFLRSGERTFSVPVGSPIDPEEREHSENIHTKED